VGRVKVLYQHEGHARIRGQMLKQLTKRFEPACRGANAHYGECIVASIDGLPIVGPLFYV